MFKSEKRLIIIQVILSLIFLLSIFIKNIINDYFIFFIISLFIGIIILVMGYEKDKNLNNNEKKKMALYAVFYCIGFLIVEYGLGFILGYIKTPYKRDLLSIFNNTFSTILIIVSSEYLRYMFVKKGENKKIILIFTFLLFVLLDITMSINHYDLSQLDKLLDYTTLIILPSIFKNFILTRLAHKYGITQNILYRLITELYVYVMPFTPDLGIYLESVFLMILPFMIDMIISIGFEKEKKRDFRESKWKSRIITSAIVLFISIVIALGSNLFRFWYVAVATGSMEPTINIGDSVIIDKSYQKHLNKIKVGDILAFKIGKKVYVHRIIDIKIKNNKYSIKTKGDRKGQVKDNWTVTNDDVIGVVKLKIKYVGYPTVWLSRLLEVRK